MTRQQPHHKTDRTTSHFGLDLVALLWGFAEATYFFIIPDFWTSYQAMKSWRSGLRACYGALIGALIGGTVMYTFASLHPAAALRSVDHVPGITSNVLQEASRSYDHDGSAAIFFGPVKTIPYKVFTVMAPDRRVGYLQFIAISVPSRMIRFVAVTGLTAGLSYLLRNRIKMRYRWIIFATCWITMYVMYFAHHWL